MQNDALTNNSRFTACSNGRGSGKTKAMLRTIRELCDLADKSPTPPRMVLVVGSAEALSSMEYAAGNANISLSGIEVVTSQALHKHEARLLPRELVYFTEQVPFDKSLFINKEHKMQETKTHDAFIPEERIDE